MGLVARLAAPAIAVAALGQPGWWPSLRSTWWQDRLGGPFPVSVPVATEDGDPRGASPSHPASDDAIEVLTTTMIEHFGLIPRIGWGNVASVVNSAAMQVAAVRPDLALQARSAADTVLALPRIEDGVLLSGPRYRRRSCCLMYRVTVARGALCGDCVLG